MKRFSFLLIIFATLSCVPQSKYNQSIAELNSRADTLKAIVSSQDSLITILRDSISLLSFPADQRLYAIKELIANEDFTNARLEISKLKEVFPKSIEAQQCQAQIEIIEKKEAAIEAEKARLKALGFKAFNDLSSITIDDRTCSFSSFSFGRTYTFDYCPDIGEYWYRTADKSSTYILASMSMSTKENFATTPSIYACKIEDGKLKQIAFFTDEYASWSSYGAKLGNYSEDSHDFAKVNSVKYKLGAEISLEESKSPIVIVTPKKDKIYFDSMTIEDVKENLFVIKILNRNKI